MSRDILAAQCPSKSNEMLGGWCKRAEAYVYDVIQTPAATEHVHYVSLCYINTISFFMCVYMHVSMVIFE